MSKPIIFNGLAEAIGAGIFPRWMAFLGHILGLLLLSIGYCYWAPLVLALWVLLISVPILLANLLPKETQS